MDAADVADELPIQEHPKVIIAEEVILQRAFVIRRQVEADGEIHAEEPVVGPAVIAPREFRSKVTPTVIVVFRKPLEAARAAVFPPQSICSACGLVHGPEVIGKDMRMGCAAGRRRIEEILQTAQRVALPV